MFEILKKNSSIILIAVVVIILLFYIDKCRQNNSDQKRIADLLEYEHIAKEYEAKDGTVVSYNNSITVTPEDLKIVQDTLLSYIENLKIKINNVVSSTIITERLRIDTLEVPVYLTSCEFDTTIQVIDSSYFMDINLTNNGLTFNTIEFPNRLGVTLAAKRPKWYKRKESIVTITNSNPYMTTDGISSYTFKKERKFWERPWFSGTVGALISGVAVWKIVK